MRKMRKETKLKLIALNKIKRHQELFFMADLCKYK